MKRRKPIIYPKNARPPACLLRRTSLAKYTGLTDTWAIAHLKWTTGNGQKEPENCFGGCNFYVEPLVGLTALELYL